MLGKQRDADARGHLVDLAAEAKFGVLDVLQDFFCNLARLVRLRPAQDDRKFVATEAADDIDFSQYLRQRYPQVFQ